MMGLRMCPHCKGYGGIPGDIFFVDARSIENASPYLCQHCKGEGTIPTWLTRDELNALALAGTIPLWSLRVHMRQRCAGAYFPPSESRSNAP